MIRKRCEKGIDRAKAKGVTFGPSPVTSQLHQVRRHSVACGAFRLNAGAQIGAAIGVDRLPVDVKFPLRNW
jgi:hypothetical protein